MTADRRAALVERLRERSQNLWTTDAELRSNQLFKEAADTITTLRAETLEEAANVADRYEIPLCETSASHIAAAIRALAAPSGAMKGTT
jgi:hypothetical protein